MVYLIIGLVILFIVLIMPLNLQVIHNGQVSDTSIFLTKIFNKRIDLDEIIKLISGDDNNLLILFKNLIQLFNHRSFIKSAAKYSKVKKVTLIYDDMESALPFKMVADWMIISIFRDLLLSNFHSVHNEVYKVNLFTTHYKCKFELVIETRLIFFIYSLLRNVKDIPKLIKFTRRKNESSNN